MRKCSGNVQTGFIMNVNVFESRHPSKIINGQRSGRHTLARQNKIQNTMFTITGSGQMRKCTLIKKNKIFPHFPKEIQERLQSQIWLNICAFPHILGSPTSYMTLQHLPSEFPYIWGKFSFLFYKCTDSLDNLAPTIFVSFLLCIIDFIYQKKSLLG